MVRAHRLRCAVLIQNSFYGGMNMTALLNDEIMGILVGEQEIIKKTVHPDALHFKVEDIKKSGCTDYCCSGECTDSCYEDCREECGWLDD